MSSPTNEEEGKTGESGSEPITIRVRDQVSIAAAAGRRGSTKLGKEIVGGAGFVPADSASSLP